MSRNVFTNVEYMLNAKVHSTWLSVAVVDAVVAWLPNEN